MRLTEISVVKVLIIMAGKMLKPQKKLLEQDHVLPYKIDVEGYLFQVVIFTKLGKISGITVLRSEDELASKEEALAVVQKLQKYNFYFEYLTKRTSIVKERDSTVAERIEQAQLILNNNILFGEKLQPEIDQLSLALEVYKQQQHKMDIYQEDIALLNEKIKEQGLIKEEDWKSAEDLSIAFMIAAYAQTIYLEATRDNRAALAKWFHQNQKQIPAEERKALAKMINVLSDTNGGLVFDQIISLLPLLEDGLLIDKSNPLPKRAQEFNMEYEAHCRFYKPNTNKISELIRNE